MLIRGFFLMLFLSTIYTSSNAQTGDVTPVHDPTIARDGDYHYVISTGRLLPMRRSADLVHWERVGDVFDEIPAWAHELIPEAPDMWAPDLSYHNGRYFLYYAVSRFGTNDSVMGLATNQTLDPDSPEYEWKDQGMVLRSGLPGADSYNVIDANLYVAENGRCWLLFGSYWTGIKMIEVDPETGKSLHDPPVIHDLARRPEAYAVEAPFLYKHDSFYYLFVSFDQCCQGADSKYRMMVGRSSALLGPYVDDSGKEMMAGGGSAFLWSGERWRGPGHGDVYHYRNSDWIVHHTYDAENGGARTLQIRPITWKADGWPEAGKPIESVKDLFYY